MPHGVGGASGRAPIQSAGREYGHIERMAHLEFILVEQGGKGTVLPQRLVGQPADRVVGGKGDRKAGAGRDAMIGPWIVRPRIAKRVDLGDQPQIVVFETPPREESRPMRNDLLGLGVDVARNTIRSGGEMRHVAGEPRWRHHAVSVGGQQNALARSRGEPLPGFLHRPTPGYARRRILRELDFQHFQGIRHGGGKLARDPGGSVRRIVHQDQDAKIAGRDRRSEAIALNGKSGETARNAIRFVSGGYRDDGATSSEMDHAWMDDYRTIDVATFHSGSFHAAKPNPARSHEFLPEPLLAKGAAY